MALIYRYVRRQKFNTETLELETLGQGGIGFRFDFIYEANTLRFSFARCADDDAFNAAESRALLDKRFAKLISYDIKDYDKSISLVDNVVAFVDWMTELTTSVNPELVNLNKHIKTIRKTNASEFAKGQAIVNRISSMVQEDYFGI